MTYKELDALPEVGGFGFREEIRDGARVRIPVRLTDQAMFHPDNGEPIYVVDHRSGTHWMLGYINGVRCKRKSRAL